MREQTVTKLMLKFYQVMELSFCFSFVGSFKSEVGRFSKVLCILRFHLICVLLLHWGWTFLKGPSLVLGGIFTEFGYQLSCTWLNITHTTSYAFYVLMHLLVNLDMDPESQLKTANSFLKFSRDHVNKQPFGFRILSPCGQHDRSLAKLQLTSSSVLSSVHFVLQRHH